MDEKATADKVKEALLAIVEDKSAEGDVRVRAASELRCWLERPTRELPRAVAS